jgi:hypothetical protein
VTNKENEAISSILEDDITTHNSKKSGKLIHNKK